MDRHLLSRIERRLKQRLETSQIPTRSLVEARRLEKLKSTLQATLSGERIASFLPTVKELSAEYDPQAIAAAALQMVYDQSCPAWMKTDWDVPTDDGVQKPIKRGGKGRSRRSYSDGNRSKKPTQWSGNRKRSHAAQ
jgi:ATP-dependent RNA helicase DeaD